MAEIVLDMSIKRAIGLVPARSGSKRIKDKNIIDFNGHPLMAWAIDRGKRANKLDAVYVSSDSDEYLEIGEKYGAIGIKRSPEYSSDDAVDMSWVWEAVNYLVNQGVKFDIYVILRPTNPFRNEQSIDIALDAFIKGWAKYDSARAVLPINIHPCKMFTMGQIEGNPCLTQQGLFPISLLEPFPFDRPTHTFFPQPIFFQTGFLQLHKKDLIIKQYAEFSGQRIMPLMVNFPEAFDINTQEDLDSARSFVSGFTDPAGNYHPPQIKMAPPRGY